jgi:hypothetical protein
MTERPSYVVAGLIAKHRELAGVIAELQRQLDQHRADLSHIDGVLRILASNLDPNTIKPKRPYRRTLYFERHELSRLILAALRTTTEPLTVDDLAIRAMTEKGFDLTDAILRTAIRDQVGLVVKRLNHGGTIENVGTGREQVETNRYGARRSVIKLTEMKEGVTLKNADERKQRDADKYLSPKMRDVRVTTEKLDKP